MSDNFVQKSSASGTTTAVATLTSVVAGNAIVAFFFNGQNGLTATLAVADGQGSYVARGTAISDIADNVTGRSFTLENANAGSHTITGTTNIGQACFIEVVEVGTSAGASAFSGANQAVQIIPGTGANALSSGNATITAAATLVGMCADTASANPVDEPATGTGFTSRDNAANATIGAYRLETGAFATDQAATATAITGTHTFLTFGVAILNAGVIGQTFTLMGQNQL